MIFYCQELDALVVLTKNYSAYDNTGSMSPFYLISDFDWVFVGWL